MLDQYLRKIYTGCTAIFIASSLLYTSGGCKVEPEDSQCVCTADPQLPEPIPEPVPVETTGNVSPPEPKLIETTTK